MKKILERQLRDIIRSIIQEGSEDIIEVYVKVRVKTEGPGSQTVTDVITDIRGIPNVVTVIQEKPLTHEPEGLVMIYLNIKLNNLETTSVDQLKKDIKAVKGVEMVIMRDLGYKGNLSID